jgi:hypothetical protein
MLDSRVGARASQYYLTFIIPLTKLSHFCNVRTEAINSSVAVPRHFNVAASLENKNDPAPAPAPTPIFLLI